MKMLEKSHISYPFMEVGETREIKSSSGPLTFVGPIRSGTNRQN